MATKVMILDDVAYVRQRIMNVLSLEGYQVVASVGTIKAALVAFRMHKPDLITLDIVLPDGSGIDFIKDILPIHLTIKIIMVSGLTHESVIADAIHAGALDYLVKPFQDKDLIRSVQRVLLSEDYILGRTTFKG